MQQILQIEAHSQHADETKTQHREDTTCMPMQEHAYPPLQAFDMSVRTNWVPVLKRGARVWYFVIFKCACSNTTYVLFVQNRSHDFRRSLDKTTRLRNAGSRGMIPNLTHGTHSLKFRGEMMSLQYSYTSFLTHCLFLDTVKITLK